MGLSFAVRRIPRSLGAATGEAERRGRSPESGSYWNDEAEAEQPWTSPPSRRRKELPIEGPLPEGLELVLSDQIYVGRNKYRRGCASASSDYGVSKIRILQGAAMRLADVKKHPLRRGTQECSAPRQPPGALRSSAANRPQHQTTSAAPGRISSRYPIVQRRNRAAPRLLPAMS